GGKPTPIRREVRDVDGARRRSGQNRKLDVREAVDDGRQHAHLIGGVRSAPCEHQRGARRLWSRRGRLPESHGWRPPRRRIGIYASCVSCRCEGTPERVPATVSVHEMTTRGPPVTRVEQFTLEGYRGEPTRGT